VQECNEKNVLAYTYKAIMLFDLDECSYTRKCVANKLKEIHIQSNRISIGMTQMFGLSSTHTRTEWSQKYNLHESVIDMKVVTSW
jgi:hypothetical protein